MPRYPYFSSKVLKKWHNLKIHLFVTQPLMMVILD